MILLRYWKSGKSYRTRESKLFVITEGRWQPDYVYNPDQWHPNGYLCTRQYWEDALGRLIQDTKAKKSKSIVTHWMPKPPEPLDPSDDD